MNPEPCYMGAVVGVPTTVLTSRCGMHVQNGINTVFGACGNGAVEMLEALRLENAWLHVVLEMAVADRDADTVQAERLEERGIWLGKEVFEELWERENMGESPKILGCWLSSGYSQRGHIIEAEGALDQY